MVKLWFLSVALVLGVIVSGGACAQHAAPAVSRGEYPVGQPHVGVMDSVNFRLSEAPGGLFTVAGAPHALAPLSFAEQLEVMGFTAFHLRVVADADGTRFANMRHLGRVALHQPGLKVVGRYGLDAEAECVTLMMCLMRLDALAHANPDHPLVVIIEPFSVQNRVLDDRRAQRWRGPVPGFVTKWVPRKAAPLPPSLSVVAAEVAHVLPPSRRARDLDEGADGRLVVLVAGSGRVDGPRSASMSGSPYGSSVEGVPFLTSSVGGGALRILPGQGVPAWALADAREEADILVVLDTDWGGGAAHEHSRISALEAAAARADVVMLSQAAGR